MRQGVVTRLVLAGVFSAGALAVLSADTITLRDGRRVTGDLVSVRNGVVEFQEKGVFSSRMLRIPRDEVRRIDLDEYVGDGRGERSDRLVPSDRDRDRDRPGASGRPSGLREREVVVSGDVPWVDTGIELRSGQMLYFASRGTVWWGPGRKDGPAGERNSPHNPGRPMPSRPAAGLIGKIGSSSNDYFFIGDDEGPIRVRASGRLFLGVNDDVFRDNHGNFRVVVSY